MNVLTIHDEHKAREIDKTEKNKFKFSWYSTVVPVKYKEEEFEVTIGNSIKKINVSGRAKCALCYDIIYYGKRGLAAITSHIKCGKHAEKESIKRKNTAMPSSFFVNPPGEAAVATAAVCPNVSLSDRVSTLEGMLLGVLAENNLPFTVAPVLVDLSKAMASDKKALSHVSMARTTASYKMRHGMAKTFFEETVFNLQSSKFSLNIDEATSTNRLRVLCILASYFSSESKKVVIDHVGSVKVTNVTADQLFKEVVSIFTKNEIPFSNLISVLMDSCNVMRGSKLGLETRIRNEKAPHLLDIDGDSCHHIHNASKNFSKPFGGFVEDYLKDLYNDFNWSADLREKLQEVCTILNIKYTAIENIVMHRWLSVYDVTVSNLTMFDPLTIFYYGFLNYNDRVLYFNICVNIYKQRNVSTEGREKIKEILKYLRNKKLTNDGKKRKERIFSKLYYFRKKLQLIMHFYTSVFPLLKKYVCLFQMKEPMIHKLYEEQKQLFLDFLSLFVKPEYLQNRPMSEILNISLDDSSIILPATQMYLGSNTSSIIGKKFNDVHVKTFLENVEAAFITCGKYLLKTLPLNSSLLKCVSAIDPCVRGHHTTLARLKRLPELVQNVLEEGDLTSYELEIHRYQVDNLSNPIDNGKPVRIDVWWAGVFESGKYPSISKMVKAVLSCFHGPQVESAFSAMSNILDKECGRMNVETLSSIQTVQYKLRKSEKSAIEFFKRENNLSSPVQKSLCSNLKNSYRLYKNELDVMKKEKETNKENLKILKDKEIAKQKAIDSIKAAEKKVRLARKRKLEKMAANIAKKKKKKP